MVVYTYKKIILFFFNFNYLKKKIVMRKMWKEKLLGSCKFNKNIILIELLKLNEKKYFLNKNKIFLNLLIF